MIEQLRVEDLIFIDEAGVNLAMARLYARALRGQRATATRPGKRGKNITMVGALALAGALEPTANPVIPLLVVGII